jgi:type II secretory pathway pseudopilin PulG
VKEDAMHERGQVIPLVAVALVGLLGAASLAVDVGYWRYQQRLEQTAADSAAIAGATELLYSHSTGWKAAAQNDAAANGYADNGDDVRVDVDHPTAGPYVGNDGAVQVVVSKKQPAFFAFILGKNYQWVSARAVAVPNAAGRECIYALTGDITMGGGGGGGISAPSCGIITDYNLNVTGGAPVNATFVGYVGSGPSGGTYPQASPQPALAATDPCPTIPSCAYLAANPPPVLTCQAQPPVVSPLPSGEYCQPLNLSGGAVLAGGLYVLDQGLTASGNGTISGTNVTIYNRGGVTVVNGNISFDLTAPATGNLAGMVYYQPPGNTSSVTVNGKSGTQNFSGAMYLPSANMTLNGNVPDLSLLVVGSLTMNGGGIAAHANGLTGVGHVVLGE